jgi:hypothetical protein
MRWAGKGQGWAFTTRIQGGEKPNGGTNPDVAESGSRFVGTVAARVVQVSQHIIKKVFIEIDLADRLPERGFRIFNTFRDLIRQVSFVAGFFQLGDPFAQAQMAGHERHQRTACHEAEYYESKTKSERHNRSPMETIAKMKYNQSFLIKVLTTCAFRATLYAEGNTNQ